jgi:hypothetical protein
MRVRHQDSIAAVAGFAGLVTPRLASHSSAAYLYNRQRMERGKSAIGMTLVEVEGLWKEELMSVENDHELCKRKALAFLDAIRTNNAGLWVLIVDFAKSANLPMESLAHEALSLLLCIRANNDPKLWNLIVDFASSAKLDLPIEVRASTLDDLLERGVPNAFLDSPLCREIQTLLGQSNIQVPESSFAGPCLSLELVPPRTGRVYILSIREDEFPGSARIKVTDEKLLEKLRIVNGQFTSHGLPVVYYDNFVSKTGEIPPRG